MVENVQIWPLISNTCKDNYLPMGIDNVFNKRKKFREGEVLAQEEALKAAEKADNLPKVFNYVCPRCLFQTNKLYNRCPECKVGKLRKTEPRD